MSAIPLVERLTKQAVTVSGISREMSEAKSLRQESNTERRTDLYMWPTPEQTTEGKAAALIEELHEALTDWCNSYWCPETNFSQQVPRLLKMSGELLDRARGTQ